MHENVVSITSGAKSRASILAADGGSWVKVDPGATHNRDDTGGGGGGDAGKFTLPDLRHNVAILNGLSVIFAAALGGMFLWLVDRIDDRFEAADQKLTTVSDKVTDIRVDVAEQAGDIKAILEKVDEKPKAQSTASTAPAKIVR